MATLFRPFKWIFIHSWRLLNFSRQLILNLLFLFLVLVVIVAVTKEEPKAKVQEGALVLDLSGNLVESPSTTPSSGKLLQQWLAGDERPTETVVSDVVYALNRAKQDPHIKGVVLDLSELQGGGIAKLMQITAALDDFRQSRKPVVAIGDFYAQHQYLLAAHADKILMDPNGAVILQGLGLYNYYFKSALAKFNITPYVFRVGTYKSFVEPYTRDNMSDEAREANSRWLGQMWDEYVSNVANSRKIAKDVVSPGKEQLLERLKAVAGDAAQYALKQKLVDQLATRNEQHQFIAKFAGSDNNDAGFRGVGLVEYLSSQPDRFAQGNNPDIGVIVASGNIINGKQTPGNIGGETLSKLIRQATNDHSIKALVLRVDSPGGSAFAAEQIRTELQAFKATGRPLVVSMGSMAASGGYWISAGADKIVAEPTTITGSIGVFGMFASIDKALEYFGIHTDGIATTDFADIDPSRPLPDHIKQIVQMNVENTYQKFITLVSKGRKMTPDQVDKIAQGRVWSGRDAKALGLVDEIGSLPQAIQFAASLAKLQHYDLQLVEPELSPREKLMQQLLGQASVIFAPSVVEQLATTFGINPKVLQPLQRLNDPRGIYALTPVAAP